MAIIKIRNTAIDLDAAEIPNIDASKITTGTISSNRISGLPASSISSGTFADARIASSNVSQHATSFDDNKIVNDLSTLALRQASDGNRSAYNTNSQYVDVFQDSTGITSLTNTSRASDEYMASVVADANTKLLLSFDSSETGKEGDDASNITVAEGGNNNGVLTSSVKKYGNNALHLPDTAALVLTPNSNAIFGSASNTDFTIEFWHKSTGGAGDYRALFVKGNHTGNVKDFRAYYALNMTTLYFDVEIGNGNYGITATGLDNVATQFNHYAFVRQGSNIRLYYNGVQKGSTSIGTGTLDAAYSTIQFGKSYIANGTSYAHGYWDDFRISNIARYPDGTSFTPPTAGFTLVTANATGSFESNAITAPSSVSSMGAIITYQDQAGTNALNTDIVLKLSADGGSNYTTATLTALPDFSTGIKMAKVNDLSVTAGTSLKYKIEFANQASGSKEARIRGVSLQY